jgi:hypothetical protein
MLESRDVRGEFEIQFENGERWRTEYSRQFERLTAPFEIGEGVVIPLGGYSFQSVRTSYNIGPQRRVAGNVALQAGGFFGGDLVEASYRGRVQLSRHLGVEPGVTLDWIDLPEGRFTTKVVRARVIYTMTPRMFVEAMPQYSSASDSITTNIRYRWEYQPGSDLFIVYTDGRNTEIGARASRLMSRGLAVKLTRLVRF